MSESVLKLKKRAVALGMDKTAAKKANRSELEDFIDSAGSGSTKKSGKAAAKKKGKAGTPAKKSGTTKKSTSTKKSAGAKKASKPKAEKPKQRQSKSSSNGNGDAGRAAIGTLDWSAESDEWNPKKGGPVEKLFKALKKRRGDVDKAFEDLKADVYEFVGKTKRDGTKRTKDEAYAMLRYRLNRTKFEFAVRTGQHSTATNRVEYGTGEYASRKKGKKGATTKTTKTTPKGGKGKTPSGKKSGAKSGKKGKRGKRGKKS